MFVIKFGNGCKDCFESCVLLLERGGGGWKTRERGEEGWGAVQLEAYGAPCGAICRVFSGSLSLPVPSLKGERVFLYCSSY